MNCFLVYLHIELIAISIITLSLINSCAFIEANHLRWTVSTTFSMSFFSLAEASRKDYPFVEKQFLFQEF